MEVVREIELDAGPDEVWEVVRDPDELAGWVGEEVRHARFRAPERPAVPGERRLAWSWAPDGSESEVELTVTGVGDRTRVRVVEWAAPPTLATVEVLDRWDGAVVDRWDGALLGLELRSLVALATCRA